MTLRFRALVLAVASVLYLSGCGETFRPIATPITSGGGDPQVRRHAVVVSSSGPAADGATTHVNVSGDTNAGQVPLGQDPVHAGLIPGSSLTFVANRASSSGKPSVTAYSTFDQPTSSNLPLVTTLPDGSAPSYIAAIPGTIYVALSGLNTVGILSSALAGLQAQIPVGTNPIAMAVLPAGNRVYVANQASNTVSVIDPSTHTVSNTIPVGAAPSYIVTSADGAGVYVVNRGSNTVSVIDSLSATVIHSAPVGPSPNFAAFDSKNLRVYVTNSGGNTISVINADRTSPNYLSVSSVTVGNNPVSLTALADGTRIYVANAGSNSISVVGGLSLAVQSTLTSGNLKPVSLVSSPDSAKVVVAFQDVDPVTATDPDSSAIVSIRTSDHVMTTIAAPTAPGACANATVGGCRMKPIFVTVSQ